MKRTSTGQTSLLSLLLSAVSLLAFATMVWIHLTDVSIAEVYWPRDIHEIVVKALGGTVATTTEYTILLPLASVLLRVVIVSVLWAITRSAVLQARQKKTPILIDPAEAGFLEAFRRVTLPGLFSLVWLFVWYVLPFLPGQAALGFVVSASPYFVAIVLAAAVCQVFSGQSIPLDSAASYQGWRELLVVIAAMIVWESTSFWMNERLYAGLLVPHGDSAMYEEHLWNVWHGKGFRSYLDQGLFLGEHIQVIHLLLLPLHIIWPSYLMMEFVASSCLAICAVPIYSIAKRHSGSARASMWLALAWLCYFPMHYLDIAIDLKTLRPSCYGLPFLFMGIDFAERRKLWKSSVCLLIALSTQEDFALIVGSIGLSLFLASLKLTGADDRQRFCWWCLGVLGFSVVYVLLAVLVVIPAFRDGEAVHYSRYFGDLGNSPGDLVRSAVREPMKILGVLFSFRTGLYVVLLCLPLAFLPLRRPGYLLAGLATFVMLSLIQLGNEANIGKVSGSDLPPVPYHHFHAPLLPVIFWAAAAALSRSRDSDIDLSIRRWRFLPHSPVDRARFAFLCALLTAVVGSGMPMGAGFWSKQSSMGWRNRFVPGERAAQFSKVLEMLPQTARVASTDYVHTRLTHFERSYDYSGYLRAVNDYKLGVPDDTDYIVIDTSHPYSTVRDLTQVRELTVEPEQWEVLPDETGGLFLVLRRRR